MKYISIILSVCVFSFLHAQDSTAKVSRLKMVCVKKQHSVRDTVVPAGPNEFYLNIAPVFVSLMGSIPSDEMKFSLFYKRSMKNARWAFRAGFLYKPGWGGNRQFFPMNQDLYFNITDTTRTVNRFQYSGGNKFQVNSGMEWRSKGNKRWSTFVGLDLMCGVLSQSYALYNYSEWLDTTGNWQPGRQAASGFEFLDFKRTSTLYAGISPKLGLRYAFNKHWIMSLQAGFDSYFIKGEYFKRNSTNTAIVNSNFTYSEFNFRAALDEFAVVYRF